LLRRLRLLGFGLFVFFVFKTFLAEQFEHFGFIGFDTWLVKRIDTAEFCGNCTGDLKEVNQKAERAFADGFWAGFVAHFEKDSGNAAFIVGPEGCFEGFVVDETERFVG